MNTPLYVPSYGAAVRNYRYHHDASKQRKGVRYKNEVKSEPQTPGEQIYRERKNSRRGQRRNEPLAKDRRIFNLRTERFFGLDACGDAYEPLEACAHPMYPELEEQYWFIDPNRHLKRKRNNGLICVFDLIFLLCFRKPPPGPFFFINTNTPWFNQLKEFYTSLDYSKSVGNQFYYETIDGKPERMQRWFHGSFETPYLQRTCLSDVWWFNPQNPYITWVPETCRWRLYYYDTKTQRNISTSYSAWNYWKAQQRLAEFLIDDLGIPEENHTSDLIEAYSGSWRFEHTHPDDNKPNRFWYNFEHYKPREQLVMGEHPRDPYWDYVYKEYLTHLNPTSYNDDFIFSIEESLR